MVDQQGRDERHSARALTAPIRVPAAIGVISDTHGLLRPEAAAALEGVDAIIHAGDVGKASILVELGFIAPVYSVRGNVDRGPWAEALPADLMVECGATLIYVLHDLNELSLTPSAAGIRVVISGHSHQPVLQEENGVLYLNPGAAGPRRFRLPISVACLNVAGNGDVSARLIELDV